MLAKILFFFCFLISNELVFGQQGDIFTKIKELEDSSSNRIQRVEQLDSLYKEIGLYIEKTKTECSKDKISIKKNKAGEEVLREISKIAEDKDECLYKLAKLKKSLNKVLQQVEK